MTRLHIDKVLATEGTLFCLAARGEGEVFQKIRTGLEKAASFLGQLGFNCGIVAGHVVDNNEKTMDCALFFAANTTGFVNETYFLKLFVALTRQVGQDFLLYRTFGYADNEKYKRRAQGKGLYQLFQAQVDASWHNMDMELKLLEESPYRSRKLKELLKYLCGLTGKTWLPDGEGWQPTLPPLLMTAEAQLSNLALCLRKSGIKGILAEFGFDADNAYFADHSQEAKPVAVNVGATESPAVLLDIFENHSLVYIICAGNIPDSAASCLSALLSDAGLVICEGQYSPSASDAALPPGRYYLATASYQSIHEEFYWRLLKACQTMFQFPFMGIFTGNPFVKNGFTLQTKTTPLPEIAGIASLREIWGALYSNDIADFASFVASRQCPGFEPQNIISKLSSTSRKFSGTGPVSPVADEDFVVYCFPINRQSSPSTPAHFIGSYGNYPGYQSIPLAENGRPEWEVTYGADAWRTAANGKREQCRLEFSQVFRKEISQDASRYLAYELAKALGLEFVMFQTKSGKVGRIFTNPQAGPVGSEKIIEKDLMSDASEWGEVLDSLAGGAWQVESHSILGYSWTPSGFYGRTMRAELARILHSGIAAVARQLGKEYAGDSDDFIYDGEANPVAIYRQMAAGRQFKDFFANAESFYCFVAENKNSGDAQKLRFLCSLLHSAGFVFMECARCGSESPVYIFARNLLYWRDEAELWRLLCRCEKFLVLRYIAKLSSFPFDYADFEPLAMTLPAMGYDGALLREKIYAENEDIFDLKRISNYDDSRIDYCALASNDGERR